MTEHALDLYYRRTYGISLEGVNALLIEQSGVCFCCRRPPKTLRLSVDHDHKIVRLPIVIKKGVGGNFTGSVPVLGDRILANDVSKKRCREKVRQYLKRRSIRGLLCGRCNRGLQMFGDKAESLQRAAEYIDRFQKSVYPVQTQPGGGPI